MIPERSPDLFRRLKPLFGKRIDALWLEHQLGDVERKREIEGLLTLLAVKHLGMSVGEERVVLEPPPPGLIGQGEYVLGSVSYPGVAPYEFRVRRNELLRHLFILGPTGTGKSTFILGLLLQFLRDGVPFMALDFKKNYRCLITAEHATSLVVVTVGRETAPLCVNALSPPPGVGFEEWSAGLADIISTSYLLMQGARNVLIEALVCARDEHGDDANLADAHRILESELRSLRPGSRRYGWLESSTRSLEELSRGGFGLALNSNTGSLRSLLDRAVVFELHGLGDDQKRFFCLFVLYAVLQFRKNDTSAREVLRHVLVFDEAHNVFPKDQYGELGIPSRLAREVREYGEAIIAATQQSDVAESLIANSGIKVILRTDFPRDVDFASKLLQIEPRWLPKLPLGTGIARLPSRFYTPFLFTFPAQAQKNVLVTNEDVRERYDHLGMRHLVVTAKDGVSVTEREHTLLIDITAHPISGITARYDRLGWNPKTGNTAKDGIITKELATFEDVNTGAARMKILTLTAQGIEYLEAQGISIPAWRRGGATHEYWRATLRTILERHRYAVSDEYAVTGGFVDLHAVKNGHEVFVEIETGKSDVTGNISKCQALTGTVVFFFTATALLAAYKSMLPPGVLGLHPADIDRLIDVLR